MNKIGFKNFRRFKDFPAIDLAPITFFVGENNAGKSTVVKGMLALSDFLNSFREQFLFIDRNPENNKNKKKIAHIKNLLKNQTFHFNSNYLAHIGTFKRALYNKAENNTITFHAQLGNSQYNAQEIIVEIIGDRNNDEAVSGIISKIILDFKSIGLQAKFDLQTDLATLIFYPNIDPKEEDLFFLPPEKRNSGIEFLKSISKEFIFEYSISDYWRRFVPDLLRALSSTIEIALSATMNYEKTKNHIEDELMDSLKSIKDVTNEEIDFLKLFAKSICPTSKEDEWMFILPPTDRIMFRTLSRIEYLYAHAVTQTVIYSAKDTNDYLSKTIHEFASMSKSDVDYKRDFIKRWMQEFNIGVDYRIISVGGEAHIVKVVNNDGEEVNLADKGMGSIQLMVLLFRLAIYLPMKISERRNTPLPFKRISQIIIIEEPEQNLHPMLQSKLADLFYDLYINYAFRFIIETHSEYLIRRTQVLVSKMNLSEVELNKQNPFKVYYFPKEGTPYDMHYLSDGHFQEAFGEGFFDEAGKWSRELVRSKRR